MIFKVKWTKCRLSEPTKCDFDALQPLWFFFVSSLLTPLYEWINLRLKFSFHIFSFHLHGVQLYWHDDCVYDRIDSFVSILTLYVSIDRENERTNERQTDRRTKSEREIENVSESNLCSFFFVFLFSSFLFFLLVSFHSCIYVFRANGNHRYTYNTINNRN